MTPDYLDFNETRIDLGYDYGAVGGMEFKTSICETGDGKEQRQALRAFPLGRWQLGDRTLLESSAELIAEVGYLKTFHGDRSGAKQGFRFKDWSDFKCDQDQAISDGIATSWQLKKKYTVGNIGFNRPIVKPVFGTVDLFVDGEPSVDGWIVNHQTGVITHDTPFPIGQIISANFEFDVPVWFEDDTIGFKLLGYQENSAIYSLENIFVTEGKMPLSLPWKATAFNSQPVIEPLDLGIVFDTIKTYERDTTKIDLASGYVRTISNRSNAIIKFDLAERRYDQKELDQILGYFWLNKGRAGQFLFNNLGQEYLVRFDSDLLNIKFEVTDDNDSLFSLSGLKLRVI